LAQLAIAWIAGQAGVTTALCCATTPQQAKENAAAAGLVLTTDDVARMRADVESLGKPLGSRI
jgi:aryl-alcohol dehydrogenase-like predicted oxidoreductase